MKHARREMVLAVFVVLFGFLVGTVIPEVFRMGTGTYAGLLSRYSLGRYESITAAPEKIFPYLITVRLQTLLFLWMSCYTAAGFLFHLAYAVWLSASGGMLLSLFMIRDGYGGIALFFCCLFPQWILYAAMWKQELYFLFQKRYKATLSELDGASKQRRSELARLARIVTFCITGCAVEAFLGTWTTKIFLQIFT